MMRRAAVAAAVLVLTMAMQVDAAQAMPDTGSEPTAPGVDQGARADGELDRLAEPDRQLGAGWRDSSDRAVTTVGDQTGLHVLVADRADGYQWRTAATLAEPLLESDQWIGQACVTGSGDHAVVVYAPRDFTNETALMERGGFAAVVDLTSGGVIKLAERVTLAYFSPGCGAGATAALSRLERSPAAGEPAKTWIGTLDAGRASLVGQVRTDGQVTSPVPVGDRVLAVKGSAVVEVAGDGAVTSVAETGGQPFRLLPEGSGGLAFQIARQDDVDLARLAGGQVAQVVATVPSGAVKLRPGAGGEVYAVGGRATSRLAAGRLPAGWRAVNGLPDSEFSTDGGLLVERAVTGREASGRLGIAPADNRPQPVRIEGRLVGSADRAAEQVGFEAHPEPGAAGRQLSPSVGGPVTPDRGGANQPDNAPQVDPATVPWDPDRACAVPRNDPAIQVYQPSPEQVEWAADLAVRGQLTFQRPANWLGNGLPAYSPQGFFPSKSLLGGGHVPAQVMLGVLAQESNLWQASWHAVDALAGNPLTSSGFYGIHWEDQDPTTIDWSEVDCGYGTAQVTTGMHTDDTGQLVNGVVMDYTKQKAVVLDYATNVAAGLRILQDKWNQTRAAGLIANDGDPQYIENWWFALWAYNSGFYPDQGDGQPWGVGWSNNPASPMYPADRQMFLTAPLDVPAEGIDDEVGYDNAKHPNHWSYPERVIGFAYTSLIRWDYASQSWQDTYTPANWQGVFTPEAQPDRLTFCVPGINQCDPEQLENPGDHPGYPPTHCLRDDLMCWWNQPVDWLPSGWNGCENCGTENRTFTTVEPRPLASSIYDSQCSTTGLPAGARVIDDTDSGAPLGPQGCWRNWTTGGDFELEFQPYSGTGGSTVYPGKVDMHQIGGGFGGHFWFTHTLKQAGNEHLKVTGRWNVDPVNAWARVLVHVPDHGAHTQQAFYKIHLPSGGTRHRAITQHHMEHTWVDIGVFDFTGSGSPVVELSNFTEDGVGVHDVAWDAVAIQPLPAKPEHFVVALGDSYSSGEGTFNYYSESYQYVDDGNHDGSFRNICRRSPDTWSRKVQIPFAPGTIGDLKDGLHDKLDYHLLACAGARTHHVLGTEITFPGQPVQPNPLGELPKGPQNGRELTGIDRGFLDENTTLVMLNIGGNDAGWTDALQTCILGQLACHTDDEFRDDLIDHITGPVPDAIAQVMTQIAAAAPNAMILLVGYPTLFSEGVVCGSAELTRPEREFLNDMGEIFSFNTVFDRTVADPTNSWRSFGVEVFEDDFSPVCSLYVSYPGQGINGVRFENPPLYWQGAGDGSFHPTGTGYDRYASAVEDELNVRGYLW